VDEDNSTDGLDDVLGREVSRKQFFGVVGAAFLGMFGILRVAEQVLNGHMEGESDLSSSAEGLFGERAYGGDDEPHHEYNHKDSTY
jgi:hypothetical protein